MRADFETHLLDQGRAARTVAAYVSDVGLFGVWFYWANNKPLTAADFTPTDVRDYKAHLEHQKKSAATINRALAALRAFGAYLVTTGQLEYNPASQARGVKQQKAAPKWLDKEAEAKLLRELEKETLAARALWAKAEAWRNLAMVVVMLNTGLRVSELIALDWSDVAMHQRSGEVTVRNGKGDKARAVPLNFNARQALSAWSRAASDADCASDAVFVGQSKRRLGKRAVQEMVVEAGRRAGVAATPHRLRHTFAKKLVNGKTSLDRVAMLMGHSRLDTTALYTLPDQRDLARAVATLED